MADADLFSDVTERLGNAANAAVGGTTDSIKAAVPKIGGFVEEHFGFSPQTDIDPSFIQQQKASGITGNVFQDAENISNYSGMGASPVNLARQLLLGRPKPKPPTHPFTAFDHMQALAHISTLENVSPEMQQYVNKGHKPVAQ